MPPMCADDERPRGASVEATRHPSLGNKIAAGEGVPRPAAALAGDGGDDCNGSDMDIRRPSLGDKIARGVQSLLPSQVQQQWMPTIRMPRRNSCPTFQGFQDPSSSTSLLSRFLPPHRGGDSAAQHRNGGSDGDMSMPPMPHSHSTTEVPVPTQPYHRYQLSPELLELQRRIDRAERERHQTVNDLVGLLCLRQEDLTDLERRDNDLREREVGLRDQVRKERLRLAKLLDERSRRRLLEERHACRDVRRLAKLTERRAVSSERVRLLEKKALEVRAETTEERRRHHEQKCLDLTDRLEAKGMGEQNFKRVFHDRCSQMEARAAGLERKCQREEVVTGVRRAVSAKLHGSVDGYEKKRGAPLKIARHVQERAAYWTSLSRGLSRHIESQLTLRRSHSKTASELMNRAFVIESFVEEVSADRQGVPKLLESVQFELDAASAGVGPLVVRRTRQPTGSFPSPREQHLRDGANARRDCRRALLEQAQRVLEMTEVSSFKVLADFMLCVGNYHGIDDEGEVLRGWRAPEAPKEGLPPPTAEAGQGLLDSWSSSRAPSEEAVCASHPVAMTKKGLDKQPSADRAAGLAPPAPSPAEDEKKEASEDDDNVECQLLPLTMPCRPVLAQKTQSSREKGVY